MKRKLLAGISVFAFLLSAYTCYAYFTTRGLQIYLMGTKMGAILAGSWQYTLLAAILLWMPGIVALFRYITKLRSKKAAMTAGKQTEITPGEEAAGGTELLEPAKGDADTTELLVPKVGSEAETELLISDKKGETELLEPRRGSGPELGVVLQETEGTEILPPEPPDGKVSAHTEKKEADSVSPKYCPNCGNLVTGKKFCARCGTKVS